MCTGTSTAHPLAMSRAQAVALRRSPVFRCFTNSFVGNSCGADRRFKQPAAKSAKAEQGSHGGGGGQVLGVHMRNSSLAGFAACFMVGYGLGFMHHHIAHVATEHSGDSIDGGSVRLRSVEARLAQLEARAALAPAHTHSIAALPADDAAADSTDAGAEHAVAVTLASHKSKHAHKHRKLHESSAPSSHDGCPAGRKPYHVILTAQDSTYQAWQTRIMVHHLRRIQKQDPCTEITGFTRLLSSPSGAANPNPQPRRRAPTAMCPHATLTFDSHAHVTVRTARRAR